MGVSVGSSFRITVAVLVVAFTLAGALAAGLAEKADARANINDYLSKGPNDFYPSGHDREGPMKLAIDTVGWNATRIAGNAGIGNGSVSIFDRTSTKDMEYPSKGFMCGDVSQQPWVPGWKNIVASAANESEKSGEDNATENATDNRGMPGINKTDTNASGNASQRFSSHTDVGTAGDEGLPANNSASEAATNNTGRNAPVNTEQAGAESENLTYAAYHPVQYLNPVRDVLYEHPLATPGTAYCELLGFVPPSGVPVNVGMKCTGYGY